MKTRKYLTIVLFFIAILTLLFASGEAQSNRMKDRFYLGAINHFGYGDTTGSTNHLPYFSALSYNAMHYYSSHTDSTNNEFKDGGFFAYLNQYYTYIHNILKAWNDRFVQNSVIFEREKVLRPAYGQRSTYQAEYDGSYWATVFPAYGYNNNIKTQMTGEDITDNSVFGNGAIVKYCEAGNHNPGLIVIDLLENCEQVNRNDLINTNNSDKRMFSDIKQPNYEYKWYIKPRMRIDSVYAKAHPDDTVAVLHVKNFDGVEINTFVIKCKNFLIYDISNTYYDGHYLEMFYQILPSPNNNTPTAFSVRADSLMMGRDSDEDWHNSHVDYYIEWKGKVDTYLDYIRVDDEWAHALFTETPENPSFWDFHTKLDSEIVSFSNQPGFGYFWLDEFAYNNIPCIKEVNWLVKEQNSATRLVTTANIDGIVVEKSGLRNISGYSRTALNDTLINSGIISNLYLDVAYPFLNTVLYPPNVNEIPEEFPISSHTERALTPEQYNLGGSGYHGIQFVIQDWFLDFCKTNRSKVKINYPDLTYGFFLQVHSDEAGAKRNSWALREPTNEEIKVQNYLALALGAKIVMDYSYYSCPLESEIGYKELYWTWGLLGSDNTPRLINYYGQAKWDSVVALNQKVKALGNIMFTPGDTNKHLDYEKTISVNRNELINSYIADIKSRINNNQGNTQFFTEGGYNFDLVNYWEFGLFNPNPQNSDNPLDKGKYFIAVNKRCTPVSGFYGDERNLLVKFDYTKLQYFNNWKIIEPLTNNVIAVINKNSNQYYNLGNFLPGEGRLFKLAPVMQEGGEFVCDEVVQSGANQFDCVGNVNSNGHNLTIKPNVIINFHQGCKIEVNDAEELAIEGNDVFKGRGSQNWQGIKAINVMNVEIGNSYFEGAISNYIIDLQNCGSTAEEAGFILIDTNVFSVGTSEYSIGAISVSNYSEAGNDFYAMIFSNIFNCIKTNRVININQMGGNICNSWIYGNTFNPQSQDCNIGIFVSNLSEGYLSYNTIRGFTTGIAGINSTLYFRNNSISTDKNNSNGLFGVSGTHLWLTGVSNFAAGEMNTISNTGTKSKNIYVYDANFELDSGRNVLNIANISDTSLKSYHLYGMVSSADDSPPDTVFERRNCFKWDAQQTQTPDYRIWKNGTGFASNYYFLPFECTGSNEDFAGFFLAYMAGGITDTVFQYSNSINNYSQSEYIYSLVYKAIRLKDYNFARTKSIELLTNYVNDVYTPDLISKLYSSTVNLDSNGAVMQQTKTYLEQLVQNNPGNSTLIKSAFYFLQKCKVYLEQYTSALAGFEEIINQNPYSYDGLIASWDYSATLLLMDTTGGAGGFNDNYFSKFFNLNKDQLFTDTNRKAKLMKKDSYDKAVFTKSDREIMFNNVLKMNTSEREKQIENFSKTEEKAKKGDLESEEIIEKMKVLKEVNKIKKPRNNTELINFVNADINKVFATKQTTDKNYKTNSIPTTFKLYQNYPNPFNPTTKISFDLPKDARVTIVIYDILGREITKLINNEFRTAGKYTTEFNGQNLSSGVYFYQIRFEDPTGRTGDFIQARKMLLLK